MEYYSNSPIRINSGYSYNNYGNRREEESYIPLKNVTEEYTFPYEIQPTDITYNNKVGIQSVVYTTSDGQEHTARLEVGTTDTVAYFDEVPEGERIVTVRANLQNMDYAIWNAFSISNDRVYSGRFNVNMTKEHEDGTPLKGGEFFQLKYTVTGNDGAFTESTAKENDRYIWFVVKELACPEISWNESIVKIAEEQTITMEGALNISGYEDRNRTSVEDPVIKMAVISDEKSGVFSTLTEAEGMSFFTGKMTVMPFLAGWTVKYHTVNGGDQEYTIPSDIPEDGLEIQIPNSGWTVNRGGGYLG